jgi:aryl-alcohol dehydrogenase-like predicted oxidoreductase
VLAAVGCSRQVRWPLGSLVEVLVALGHNDGLAPIVTLQPQYNLLQRSIEFELVPVCQKPHLFLADRRMGPYRRHIRSNM